MSKCECDSCKNESYDCLWICPECKAHNSNYSDDDIKLWTCFFCNWNDWDKKE